MAQLYATTNRCLFGRISIRLRLSSPLHSKHGVQNHVELRPNNRIMRSSIVGLYTMNGGEGPLSYAQNSSYQRGAIDVAKPIIEEEIVRKLDIKQLCSNGLNSFCVGDFGCSTGDNSFAAMQIITESVEKKFQIEGLISQIPNFHVFFSDQIMNDFNTLFRSLPPERHYQASGVPGSFYGLLLPKASLHFAYSSFALHWLSQVPKAVEDHKSPAWNKGKIHYMGARQEVLDAYSSQYANDIESFLEARAQELVSGGLMALLVPAVPTNAEDSNTSYSLLTEIALVGSCLMDMAKKGRLSEAKVDSFNVPLYLTFPQELKAVIERTQNYSIERMEILSNPGKLTLTSANARASFIRAASERLLIHHFGCEIIDELFARYTEKLAASRNLLDPNHDKSIIIFVLLKRKVD